MVFGWWNLFYELPWMLRGMENLLCDLHADPEPVHRLCAGLCVAYVAWIRHAARVLSPDGFWTSDDLGHQTGPMMGPAVFHDVLFPHYRALGAALHAEDLHFWLHSCGDNTLLLDDFIAAGVDVFHPVQHGCIDGSPATSTNAHVL